MTISRLPAVSSPAYYLLGLAMLLLLGGCSAKHDRSSLTDFAQRGPVTLVELRDNDGRQWKILSAESGKGTAYWVITEAGKIDILAAALPSHEGPGNAVVYVDSGEKEDALAILDRKFLSSLQDSSDAYKKWLSSKAIFTYGSVAQTRMIDFKPGGLGTTNIGTKGGQITGQLAHGSCSCSAIGLACTTGDPVAQQCTNDICDWLNCVVDIINGVRSECNGEAFAVQSFCHLLN
jgi:hypothetical protein